MMTVTKNTMTWSITEWYWGGAKDNSDDGEKKTLLLLHMKLVILTTGDVDQVMLTMWYWPEASLCHIDICNLAWRHSLISKHLLRTECQGWLPRRLHRVTWEERRPGETETGALHPPWWGPGSGGGCEGGQQSGGVSKLSSINYSRCEVTFASGNQSGKYHLDSI